MKSASPTARPAKNKKIDINFSGGKLTSDAGVVTESVRRIVFSLSNVYSLCDLWYCIYNRLQPGYTAPLGEGLRQLENPSTSNWGKGDFGTKPRKNRGFFPGFR